MLRTVTELLKRLHIWVGLFNFTIILVFAAAGIHVTLDPAPAERKQPKPEVREIAYEAPGDFTDHQIAKDLFEKLDLPLSGPIPDWAIGRDAANVLVLDFYTSNGLYKATLLEDQKKVRIEFSRNSTIGFLSLMHTTTLYHSTPDWRVRLWALYVDISIFSLLFMAVTGTYLWLTSRPKLRFAQLSLAAGTLLFAFLWVVAR